MTDSEILAKWRTKNQNPYLSLSTAKALEKLERRFGHLKIQPQGAERPRSGIGPSRSGI
ncbi:hypothetical protein [Mycolicibacterium hippocampi]|uniref:Uncharacterized protein n=1 Tax=Mycolicibacterium hippocampi TaxID=659824 RepID=A0A7I9ZPM7_9MYCO|nr:hypothetical protein [Mycolicibacterium hippocampi]GFH02984.1 hypothetical protein MHIP_34670 [Mycolicibacterium hippocampi]